MEATELQMVLGEKHANKVRQMSKHCRFIFPLQQRDQQWLSPVTLSAVKSEGFTSKSANSVECGPVASRKHDQELLTSFCIWWYMTTS